MAQRIGPQMISAVRFVEAHPGCRQYEVAQAVGPHGSNGFGTRIVRRAEAAGLIRYEDGPRAYRLFATDAGLDILGQQ